MKRIGLVAGLLVSQMAFAFDQNGNEACFYEHANYQGKESCYKVGQTSWVGSVNDSFSSLKLSTGVKVSAYQHINFGGAKVDYSSTINYVGNDMNDQISSLIVTGNKFNPNGKKVCFYKDEKFEGKETCYDVGQVNYIGDALNDSFSSLRVPKNVKVDAFEHNNYGGVKNQYVGDVSFVGQSFNDKISSLRSYTTTFDSNGDSACFYEHSDFEGRSNCYEIGKHSFVGDLNNDMYSSVKVSRGVKVEAFEHINNGGAKVQYASTTDYVGNNFNDKISSLIVSENVLNVQSLLKDQASLGTFLSTSLVSYFNSYRKITLRTFDGYWLSNIVLPANVQDGSVFVVKRDSTYDVSVQKNGTTVALEKGKEYTFTYTDGKWN